MVLTMSELAVLRINCCKSHENAEDYIFLSDEFSVFCNSSHAFRFLVINQSNHVTTERETTIMEKKFRGSFPLQ